MAETASLVNESRRRRVDISRDRYARLWVRPTAAKQWDEMAQAVYPHDDIELSLRNRFFLERVDHYVTTGQVKSFVNVGAGFTSYPFLMAQPVPSIEIDLPSVIEYKRSQIRKWQGQRRLPKRRVRFLAVDLRSRQHVAELECKLASTTKPRPSFFLIEGLTYYLRPAARRRLLRVISRLQRRGSVLALDFWTRAMLDHPVTKRWRRYLAQKGWHPEDAYNPFEVSQVSSISGYELAELTHVAMLERTYASSDQLSHSDRILPEYYAVLRRTGERMNA